MRATALACFFAAVLAAGKAYANASVVEIVTVGPEPQRREMEVALRSLLASDPRLSWVAEDAAPASPQEQPQGPPRIWIDVATAGQFRIIVPVDAPSGQVSVRTVTAQDSDEASATTAARETVAQIVGECVRALRAEVAEAPPPPLPTIAPEPPVPAVVAQPAPVPTATKARRFEITLGGGAHTAPFDMAEPSSESNWLGPSVQTQLRCRIGKATLAIRAAWEKTDKTIDSLWLHTQFYRMAVAAFRRVQLESVDLGVGVEIGGLYLRQSTEPNFEYVNAYPRDFSPGTLRKTESLGWFYGPLVEANVRLAERWFFHVDFGASIDHLRIKGGSASEKTAWKSSPSIRGTLGLGVRI